MISNGADLHVMFPALPHAPHCLGWEGGVGQIFVMLNALEMIHQTLF